MYKPYFLPYADIVLDAKRRYPMALEFAPNKQDEKEHKGTDLKPDFTADEKKRWEWENVLERTESEMISELAGKVDFSHLSRILSLVELRLRALEKK